ncbi:MAG: C40 family peptidase [Eubacterium sp.]|nr:C40 family peptidase [Eubacterium sp.]
MKRKKLMLPVSCLLIMLMVLSFGTLFVNAEEDGPVLKSAKITVMPGEEYKIPYDEDENFEIIGFSYEASKEGATVSKEGVITADAAITEKTEVWLDITLTYKNRKKENAMATDAEPEEKTKEVFYRVTIFPLDLSKDLKPIAKDLTREIEIPNYTSSKITVTFDDTKIASFENGVLKALSTGTTPVTVKKVADGKETTETMQLTVTDPSFTKTKDAIAEYGSVNIKQLLSGICEQSEVTDLTSSKPENIQIVADTLNGLKKKSSVKITCTVDGRPLTTTFVVTRSKPKGAIKVVPDSSQPYYYYSCRPVIMKKGKKETFKATGTCSVSHMTFNMADTSIATVSSAGVVNGKKNGSTHFIATIDYRDYYITTVVAKSKAVKVLKKAYTALGKNYSQPKRMQKDYYDCSSLVYRSYSPYGITFGTYGWAPTAAMEADYMYKHGKMKYHKGVSYKKLKPGDIIFIGDCKKGYYPGIHHVAIYVGDDTIIHAAGTAYGVIQSNYTSRKKSVGCIARPF